MGDLNSLLLIDRLQPKTASLLAATSSGYAPKSQMAMGLIEVAPALDMHLVTDAVLKQTDIEASLIKLDSRKGWIGIHGQSPDDINAAFGLILDAFGDAPALKVKIHSRQTVSRIDPRHAMLINRSRMGDLCVPNESLYTLDCTPATHALLACNEVEKAANVRLIELRYTGSVGRLILSGPDAEVQAAVDAAETALQRCGA